MPFLNTPIAFFKEAIESVRAQHYQQWELVLVDDGSTGACAEFARQYTLRDPHRVRLVSHGGSSPRGISAARNLGISQARGQYIAFLDSDDLWRPEALARQVPILEACPQAAMLYATTQYWHSWFKSTGQDYVPQLGIAPDSLVQPPWLLPHFLVGDVAVPCTCSLLVRREVFDSVGRFEEMFDGMYEDQVFYAKVTLAAPVYVAGSYWARYRQHPTSTVSVARKTGQMEATRRRYLNWLEGYLITQNIKEQRVWRALRKEQRLLEDTGWSGLRRNLATLERRARKALYRQWPLRPGKATVSLKRAAR
jgi:glycosyltransferase involved in cell wall biosynthesis